MDLALDFGLCKSYPQFTTDTKRKECAIKITIPVVLERRVEGQDSLHGSTATERSFGFFTSRLSHQT